MRIHLLNANVLQDKKRPTHQTCIFPLDLKPFLLEMLKTHLVLQVCRKSYHIEWYKLPLFTLMRG